MAGLYGVDWSSAAAPARSLPVTAPGAAGQPRRHRPTGSPARIALGLLVLSVLTNALASLVGSQLIWNRTASLPLGIYARLPIGNLRRGDEVALRVPASVRQLVRERGYLPEAGLLVKPIAAMAGDTVCRRGDLLLINGAPFGAVRTHDSEGRPLPSFGGCRVLGEHDVFLASAHPRSFDSRTFGPVDVRALQSKVTPLWTY